ncbi:MAG: hypothetical protein EA344_03360 [Alkalicoccus sp.]|nr:MAG: hypothetical protein EA344_03360 [Alkalicoccus sp.]
MDLRLGLNRSGVTPCPLRLSEERILFSFSPPAEEETPYKIGCVPFREEDIFIHHGAAVLHGCPGRNLAPVLPRRKPPADIGIRFVFSCFTMEGDLLIRTKFSA